MGYCPGTQAGRVAGYPGAVPPVPPVHPCHGWGGVVWVGIYRYRRVRAALRAMPLRLPRVVPALEIRAALLFDMPLRLSASYTRGRLIDAYFLPGIAITST